MSLDNVLFGDDLRVSGIVDFGDMTHAPLVCDLAVAIADVLHGHPDAVDAADAIIGGYVSVTPLDNDEAGLLADLVAARLATEVTVTAWRGGLYPTTPRTRRAASREPARSWMPLRQSGWTLSRGVSATPAVASPTDGPLSVLCLSAAARHWDDRRCSTQNRFTWFAARVSGCSIPTTGVTSTATTTWPWSATVIRRSCRR